MDLYEPLYVQRPVEQLNLHASLRPQVYGQDMEQRDEAFRRLAQSGKQYARRGGMGGGMMGGMGAPMAANAPAPATAPAEQSPAKAEEDVKLEISRLASAEAGEVGELFQYELTAPVSLERQKSAMLPIVNETIEGEKVSIYNEMVQAKHPLNGLRLVNSTALNLMQGPVTVFDGGTYAGDAIIEDLSPKAERLISYALDLKTEVAPTAKSHPEQLVSVRLVKGTMLTNRKLKRTHEYTVKNSDVKEKTVLIEYPLDPNWKLVEPAKPTEKTRDRYRFAVKAEPGNPTTLTIDEEQTISQSLGLANLDNNLILFYVNQKQIDPAVKAVLQEIVKRKTAIEQVAQDRQRTEQQIAAITQEQDRIRQNMAQLDRNTELYKRYVQKFGTQEDSVEKMRDQIQKLTSEEARQRKSLDEYLLGLNV